MPIDKKIDGKGSEQFVSGPQLYTGTSPFFLNDLDCHVLLLWGCHLQ